MSLTEADLSLRRQGITGTDAPALLGVSQWKTPFSVWCEKKRRDLLPPLDDERKLLFEMGHLQEPIVARMYELRNHVTLFSPRTHRSKVHDFMILSPDRHVNGILRGVEIKTVTMYAMRHWGEEGTDQIPLGYYYQCLHYMVADDIHDWHVAALIAGNKYAQYYAPWDDELAEHLVEVEREFFLRYIAGDEMPPIDDSFAAANFIKRQWPKSDPNKVIELEGQPHQLEWQQRVQRMIEARKAAESAESAKAAAEADVKLLMDSHERLYWTAGGVSITWKSNKDSERTDWKSLAQSLLAKLTKEDAAQLVREHTATTEGTRPFKVSDGD